VLSWAYDFVLRLPDFKGKSKLAGLMRRLLAPKASTVIYGLVMELDPAEWLQIDLRAAGRLEPRTTAAFEKILRRGDTYVDVGAHVGYHALVARHFVGESGRVIAVDPQPYNCNRLLINAGLNDFHNITVVAAAAGASDGFASLRQQPAHDKARLSLAGAGVTDRELTFVVPVIPLARLFRMHDIGRVDLLKIDVEDFEIEVLRGAGDTLAAVQHIIIEVLPDGDPRKARHIEQLLQGFGFRLSDVEGAEWRPGQPCVENNVWARRR
jgi:FkbM family methyltransferase